MFYLLAQNGGFLPTRGSIMLDFVFTAMFGIVLILAASIYLVRSTQKYDLHKWIQIISGAVLLLTVIAFEVDMRFFTDWKALAKPSPYFEGGIVHISLYIHLLFAVPTPFLWIYVIVTGLRKFPAPAAPNEHSASHKFWAWPAAIGMFMTAFTGWIFYYLAFVA